MWFAPDVGEVYTEGIRPALEACGYEGGFRVDDPEHDADEKSPAKIDDRILAGIRRCRFLVADARGSRTSVYYEAGFADGLGIPVIWCCLRGKEHEMAFDTRQLEHIIYDSPEDLRKQLIAKIERKGWRLIAPA